MTDHLSKKLIEKFAPIPTTAMSQEEEERVHGVKAPSERGGRLPKFYRHEVNLIRNSMERASVLAERYGVSIETIRRVQEVGRYAGTTYIPRDEVDRTIEQKPRPVPMAKGVVKGRPFKSGRAPLTERERKLIAYDIRPVEETATSFKVSVAIVKQIRRAFGTSRNRTGALTHKMVRDIYKDERPLDEIAEENRLPQQIIRSIKEGTFSQKLKADN